MSAAATSTVGSFTGARFVSDSGYDGCVELANKTTRVVLEPNVGGRVSSYALEGCEALHQDPDQHGVHWDGRRNILHPAGGRFDLGPEYGGLTRDEIWFGRWTAEIVGPQSALLTSSVVAVSGLQVRRQFTLAAESPHLRCTQIISNRGAVSLRAFHWGRTFVPGGGVALAPLPAGGRFPRGYALGGPAGMIDFLPEPEPNARVRDGTLEIIGPPAKAKFNFDVSPGWLAYLARSGLLFVKRFPVYADRPYGELAANNASIWYGGAQNTPAWPLKEHVVELEPMGPWETIAPGASAEFTEEWWLAAFGFPANGTIDLNRLRETITSATEGPGSSADPVSTSVSGVSA